MLVRTGTDWYVLVRMIGNLFSKGEELSSLCAGKAVTVGRASRGYINQLQTIDEEHHDDADGTESYRVSHLRHQLGRIMAFDHLI